MKAARIEKSKRLQRVLLLLSDGQWQSLPDSRSTVSMEWMSMIGTPAKTLVSELRANGIAVKSRRIKGSKTWEYRIGNAA